jgi:chaperone required for assembly of F1-ATPase
MAEWAAKRFWKMAEVAPAEGGFQVLLDGRALRTPARRPVEVPAEALASALAAEWQAQPEVIDPRAMPMSRMTNSAIDTVAQNRDHVIDTIAAYGDSDLLCYRAAHPEGLVARQAAVWNPLLDWAAAALGARLEVHTGVMHRPQPPAALGALRAAVAARGPFQLAALHELVALSGSLVIGLRAAAGDSDIEALWAASRLDEIWQSDLWGVDDEAEAMAALRRTAFLEAGTYHRLSSS